MGKPALNLTLKVVAKDKRIEKTETIRVALYIYIYMQYLKTEQECFSGFKTRGDSRVF